MNLPEVCRDPLPTAGLARALGPGRADRHGHRPGRVARRGARLHLLFGIPLFRAGLLTGVVRVRDPRAPVARRSGRLESGDRRPRRRHRGRLRGRSSSLLGPARHAGIARGLVVPRLRRHREPAARHRDPRGDRHAARRLPALGAHPAPVVGRTEDERRRILRFERIDVIIAMTHRRRRSTCRCWRSPPRSSSAAGSTASRTSTRLFDQRSSVGSNAASRSSASRFSPRGSRRRRSARWPARS